MSTPDFWCQQKKEKKFPILSEIALKIYSIPASSAFIERFFSIAGVINNKRRCNMNQEKKINIVAGSFSTFIIRILLKKHHYEH